MYRRFVSCTQDIQMYTNILDAENNLLPESDEELDQEIAKIAESLFKMGLSIPAADCCDFPKLPIEDKSYKKIYQDIGLRNQMSAEKVRNYIYVTMSAMIKKVDPDMNEYMYTSLGAAYGKKSKVPTVEDFILFMYAMLRRGECMLGI